MKTLTAANLDKRWVGFPLEQTLAEKWGKPVRLCNDAWQCRGYGAISGRGVELVLTLGTGLGSAPCVDGRLCAGLESGAPSVAQGQDLFEEVLGRKGLNKIGVKKWKRTGGSGNSADGSPLQLGQAVHRWRQRTKPDAPTSRP